MGLNIRLKGYVYRQQSIHHQTGEWFCYNFAARSFHTKKVCSRLHSTELEFYSQKRQICFFEPPLGELWVTYALYLQLVGQRVIDFPFAIMEHTQLALSGRRGHCPSTSLVFENQIEYPFMWCQNFSCTFFSFRHKARV